MKITKRKRLTPSAASMKRTTPSEILMLDVISSEKFTCPGREIQNLSVFFVILWVRICYPVKIQHLVYP